MKTAIKTAMAVSGVGGGDDLADVRRALKCRWGYEPFDAGLGGNKRMADGLRRIADGFDRAEREGRAERVWSRTIGSYDPDTGFSMDALLRGSSADLCWHIYRIIWDDDGEWDFLRAIAALTLTAESALGEEYIRALPDYCRERFRDHAPLARGLCELGLLRGDVNPPVSEEEIRVWEGEGYLPENRKRSMALHTYGAMRWDVETFGSVPVAKISDMSRWARAAADYLERHWNGDEARWAPDSPKDWDTAPAGGY